MPELPEVETVRRSLLPYLPGRVIDEVEVRSSLCSQAAVGGMLVLVHPTPSEFTQRLRGQTFDSLGRHGKLLNFRLTGPRAQHLLIHLGMTGQLTYRDPGRIDQPFQRHPKTGLQRSVQHPVDQHTHISFRFSDGTEMHYRDIRKFGKWRLYHEGDPALDAEFAKLGPDPLTPAFTLKGFGAALKGTGRAIKAVLLDQGVVAGVGNIYADEALHRAGIRPLSTSSALSRSRVQVLYEAVREVLELGLRNGGTSLSDYVDGEGRAGTNQEQLRAYGREHEPCCHCNTPMVRILVTQRSTTYCPKCQK